MTNYRDNCFDYKDVIGLSLVPPNVYDVVVHQIETANYSDETAFKVWISEWKSTYNYVSRVIGILKKDRSAQPSVRDVALNIMAKLANNLINARQKLLDQRRAVRFPA